MFDLWTSFVASAERDPDALAIVDGEVRLTYAAWYRTISAAVAVLLSLLIAGSFSIGGVLAAGVVPFLGGLLGGWLGERQQGMRMPTA